ncbi:MAG: hypothetical protein KA436_02680 [Oligoflexales bacterium]|nr:hypothetical protein [Oligoflexales bacterium]
MKNVSKVFLLCLLMGLCFFSSFACRQKKKPEEPALATKNLESTNPAGPIFSEDFKAREQEKLGEVDGSRLSVSVLSVSSQRINDYDSIKIEATSDPETGKQDYFEYAICEKEDAGSCSPDPSRPSSFVSSPYTTTSSLPKILNIQVRACVREYHAKNKSQLCGAWKRTPYKQGQLDDVATEALLKEQEAVKEKIAKNCSEIRQRILNFKKSHQELFDRCAAKDKTLSKDQLNLCALSNKHLEAGEDACTDLMLTPLLTAMEDSQAQALKSPSTADNSSAGKKLSDQRGYLLLAFGGAFFLGGSSFIFSAFDFNKVESAAVEAKGSDPTLSVKGSEPTEPLSKKAIGVEGVEAERVGKKSIFGWDVTFKDKSRAVVGSILMIAGTGLLVAGVTQFALTDEQKNSGFEDLLRELAPITSVLLDRQKDLDRIYTQLNDL